MTTTLEEKIKAHPFKPPSLEELRKWFLDNEEKLREVYKTLGEAESLSHCYLLGIWSAYTQSRPRDEPERNFR